MGAVLDYHLHLWPHGQPDRAPTTEQLAAYWARAAAAGVREIAVTEHLFRFAQADVVLGGFWDDDPRPHLRRTMATYWGQHARADLDVYVDAVLAARSEGLPVVLGLEVDHYRGRMDKVGALVDGYPFDVVLGSVHWLGAWGFDHFEDAVVAAEWDARSTESVWAAYAEAVEDLAASGVCDVLAHPDLCKVAGRVPADPSEYHDRLAEAAAAGGLVAEVSSAGWRKPVGEAYPARGLLERFRAHRVPVTTASDAHRPSEVGHRFDELHQVLAGAGYDSLTAFSSRKPRQVALGPQPGPQS